MQTEPVTAAPAETAVETQAAATQPIADVVPPTTPLDLVGVSSGEAPAGEALAFFNPDALPLALLLLLGAAIAVRLVHRLANGLADRMTVHRLAIKQGATLAGFAIYAIGVVASIGSVFELSAQALFALSGTLAVAAGFLLRDVAEAIVAGLSILISRPFSVGDRIQFGGYYGEVKDIGLRTVRLVTLDDNLVTIPSNKFLSESVASANAGELDCMVVMSFYVDADADHDRASQIVRDAVMSSRFCYLGKPISLLIGMKLVEQLGVVIEITAKAYVFDARHEKAFASDVTQRVLRALRKAQIALPSVARAA
ncbi:MAG: mechanosensitive ion channel domain-containing protein [Myxococcota bacterium]